MLRERQPSIYDRAITALENIYYSVERIAEALEGMEAKQADITPNNDR